MRLVALGCCVLLLSACGAGAPSRSQYLLRADVPALAVHSDVLARIGLGRITVAPYLDQFGLVIETEDREVHAARNHQWAEPLADGLRLYLRDAITSALGEEVAANDYVPTSFDYVVDVTVEQLHGTRDGKAVLVASFRITGQSKAGSAVSEQRFAETKSLDREGYAGLVDAEVALLQHLAEAIAEKLPKAPARPAPRR